jgi:hypothetical protein
VPGGERLLVGRDRELATIEAVLAGARAGEPAALLLHGEPGVGKTALLRAATAHAVDLRVLSATGIEAESELAFAGLTELLGPIAAHRATLPHVQAGALASSGSACVPSSPPRTGRANRRHDRPPTANR